MAVLLAAYNGSKYIVEQVNTILNQKKINVHIFISIDLSNDNTYELLIKNFSGNCRITILSFDSSYGSASKNFFSLIRNFNPDGFDYICFSDQDDIWFDNKVISGINDMGTEYKCYSSSYLAFWPDSKTSYINKGAIQKRWDYIFEGPGPGCTFIFSVDFFNAFRNFLVSKWDFLYNKIDHYDWYIYAYARSRLYKWFISSDALIYYRQHSNNLVGANIGLFAIIKRLKYIYSGLAYQQIKFTSCSLGISSVVPILILNSNRFFILFLPFLSFSCRRNFKDVIYFSFLCLLFIFKRP